jgi:hypothetical protein
VLLEKSDSRGSPGTPALPGNYVSGLWLTSLSAVVNRKVSAKAAEPVKDGCDKTELKDDDEWLTRFR